MAVLRKLWWGKYSLPVAFWGFYCGGWLVWVAVFLLIFAASRFAMYASLAVDLSPIAWIVYVLRLAYLVVSSVGV